jgi:hypothetical protein
VTAAGSERASDKGNRDFASDEHQLELPQREMMFAQAACSSYSGSASSQWLGAPHSSEQPEPSAATASAIITVERPRRERPRAPQPELSSVRPSAGRRRSCASITMSTSSCCMQPPRNQTAAVVVVLRVRALGRSLAECGRVSICRSGRIAGPLARRLRVSNARSTSSMSETPHRPHPAPLAPGLQNRGSHDGLRS